MRRHSRYLIGGTGVAAAMLSFVICLEVAEIATALPRSEPQAIDRTLKGDRLPTLPRPSVSPASRMPEGCESSVSSIRNPKAREVVGRCLAALPNTAGAPARLG